jgi:5-methylcytosine-specific restriction protein A
MPRRAKTPCRHSGCAALLDKPGFCDKHRREEFKVQKQFVTDDYKERNRFYQRIAWKNVRALQLQLEPLCRLCRSNGKLIAATVVDHRTPIAEGGAELDLDNLQSLCSPCHNAKTRGDSNRPGGGSNLYS